MFVAFTLDPMLSSVWRDPQAEGHGTSSGLTRRLNAWMDALSALYKRALAWSLGHRKAVLALAGASFVASHQGEAHVTLRLQVGTNLVVAEGVFDDRPLRVRGQTLERVQEHPFTLPPGKRRDHLGEGLRIAEVIGNQELDPLVLVNLVGEGKVVNSRRFVKDEQLEDILDKQRKIFSQHEKTPLDEFLADFQNPTIVLAAIKQNIQTLTGKEKALFASLFSDDVLLHCGVNKRDIQPLRAQGRLGWLEGAAELVVWLSAANSSFR